MSKAAYLGARADSVAPTVPASGEVAEYEESAYMAIYGLQKHYRGMVARRKYNFSLAELIRAEERDGGLKDERVARQQRYTTSLDAKFAGRFRPGACTPLTPRSAPASHPLYTCLPPAASHRLRTRFAPAYHAKQVPSGLNKTPSTWAWAASQPPFSRRWA